MLPSVPVARLHDMPMIVDDPACTVRHRAEILAIVDRMQRERTLTTVEFGDGRVIVSSVLQVRREAGALIFDIARDAEQNRCLFASPALAFMTELDNIQIAFRTGAASLIECADGPAAVVGLPAALVRLQRRAWFRAALPVQPPIRCTVLDGDGNAAPARAIDLSPGGAALLVDGPARAARPGSGHELILSLPDVGPVTLEATLRTTMPARGSANATASKVRMGFRFEGVPPRIASQIQRYVQHLEVTQLRMLRRRD